MQTRPALTADCRLLGLWRFVVPARHQARVIAPGPHLLHLVTAGRYRLDLAGRGHEIGPGTAIWYRGGEAVRWRGRGSTVRFLSCRFEAPGLAPPVLAQRAWAAEGDLVSTCDRLWTVDTEAVDGPWRQQAALAEVLAALARGRAPGPASPWDAIEANVLRRSAWDQDMASLARDHAVSRPTLDRLCRARHGCGPAARLRRLRLERAQALLTQTPLPVAAVAERLRYRDGAELARACRRHFGCSPRELRGKGKT